MTETEKRKQFLINSGYILALAGLYYFFMKYAFWLLFPFMFSAFAAMLLQRPVRFLSDRTKKLKKSTIAYLLVAAIFLTFTALLSLVGIKLFFSIKGLFTSLAQSFKDLPSLLAQAEASIGHTLRFLPGGVQDSITAALHNFIEKFSFDDFWEAGFSVLSGPLSGVWTTAKLVPEFVVGTIISIVSCFFMTADYETITGFIKRRLGPQKLASVVTAKKSAISAVGKMVKAYAILMFITFGEMIVGLGILRLVGLYKSEYLLATAVLVAVVDIVPVLGTGTVLLPWAAFSFLTDKTGLGIGLLVMYIIIYVIRQGIEPKIVAGTLGLPPILTLVSMYIGAKLFGFIGLFALPITLIVVKILNDEGILKLWPAPYTERVSATEPTPSADELSLDKKLEK